MKNKKGQSLIDVVFSIGILSLVLVGVMMLVVSTAKAKLMASERQKAIQLSQLLIENEVSKSKDNTLSFWSNVNISDGTIESKNGVDFKADFNGYLYDVEYENCGGNSCKIIFTVKWGNSQSLAVERLFLRQGL